METEKYENNQAAVTVYRDIPYAVLSDDLPSYLKQEFFDELGEIKRYYDVYHRGSEFLPEGSNGDYIPSTLRFKKCKSLIDKEARFLFANSPTFYVNRNQYTNEQEKELNTQISDFINKVLDENHVDDKLLKAAKDCFIGKRVACMLNFNEESGISITFLKSLEFLYEEDENGRLSKIVAFYTTLQSKDKKQQRIKKKVYFMENGYCHVTEVIYDGLGNVIETLLDNEATAFEYIPAVVILNDGLTNESKGESEIDQLDDYEEYYSKMSNADIDAGRKSMNPTRYTIDAAPESTESLSTAPGAYWDLKSNDVSANPRTASAGMLEASMSYSGPLATTLERIDNQMHSQIDLPNLDSEHLQGMITSGKTLKALYWGLIVRCDEKMKAWAPALRFMIQCILDGARLYPESAKQYTDLTIPEMDYDIEVENNYPLPEDEQEEKTMDLAEVQSQTMSRKAYMKKWRELTDQEADEELIQILKEKQMFEDAYIPDEFAEDFEGMMPLGAEDMEEEDAGLTEDDLVADQQARDDLLAQLDSLLAEMGG